MTPSPLPCVVLTYMGEKKRQALLASFKVTPNLV